LIRRVVVMVLAVSVVMLARVARAAEPTRSRAAIVEEKRAGAAGDEAVQRLRAELGAAGLDVVVSRPLEPGEAAPSAPGPVPFAVIVIDDAGDGVVAEVTVLDPTGKTPRTTRVDARDVAATGLAIRVVERLRASLLELGATPEAARRLAPDVAAWAGVAVVAAPPAPPARVVDSAAPPRESAPQASWTTLPRSAPPKGDAKRDGTAPAEPSRKAVLSPFAAWVGAGVGAQVSVGGLGAAIGPRVASRLDLPAGFTVHGTMTAATGLSRVDSAGGSAKTRASHARLGADWSYDRDEAVVAPRIGVAVGMLTLAVDGEIATASAARASAETVQSFALGADAGVAFRLASGVRIGVEVDATLALPEPVVSIAGANAAHVGLPLFEIGAGIEVRP
jgi:hypothetical protein